MPKLPDLLEGGVLMWCSTPLPRRCFSRQFHEHPSPTRIRLVSQTSPVVRGVVPKREFGYFSFLARPMLQPYRHFLAEEVSGPTQTGLQTLAHLLQEPPLQCPGLGWRYWVVAMLQEAFFQTVLTQL